MKKTSSLLVHAIRIVRALLPKPAYVFAAIFIASK
jgi:hypothetical protein